MEVVTARKHDNAVFEFEGDKIADLQRVYQGRVCEHNATINKWS